MDPMFRHTWDALPEGKEYTLTLSDGTVKRGATIVCEGDEISYILTMDGVQITSSLGVNFKFDVKVVDVVVEPPPTGTVSHVRTTAQGDGTGRDYANAAGFAAIPGFMAADRTIFLYADEGPFNLSSGVSLTQGGTADNHRCLIQGVDRFGNAEMATIVGSRTSRNKDAAGNFIRWVPPTDHEVVTACPLGGANGNVGQQIFILGDDVNYVTWSHLRFDHVADAWRQTGSCRGLTLEDIEGLFVRSMWQQDASKPKNDFIAKRISVDGYSKQCFDNLTCENLVYEDLWLNSHRVDQDNFAIGIPVGYRMPDFTEQICKNLTVRTSTAWKAQNKKNWIGRSHSTIGSYWNGDSISAELGASQLVVEDTILEGCTDGGCDDKSPSPIYRRCVFTDNKRNVRVWSHPSRFEDCELSLQHGRGGGSAAQVYGIGCDAVFVGGRILNGGVLAVETNGKLTFQGVDGASACTKQIQSGSSITIT